VIAGCIKAGTLIVPLARIEAVDLTELERGRVMVTHAGGQTAWASGVDAYDLVLRLHPSALEGRRLRWVKHAWALHNLVAHPLMQVLAWLGLPRLGIALHDRTVPRPLGE
jgi:hypothetical protein